MNIDPSYLIQAILIILMVLMAFMLAVILAIFFMFRDRTAHPMPRTESIINRACSVIDK